MNENACLGDGWRMVVDDKVTGFLVDYTQLLVGAGAVWRVAVSFCHSLPPL